MGLHPRIWMAVPDDGEWHHLQVVGRATYIDGHRLPRGGCLGALVALGVLAAVVALALAVAVWQWTL